MLAAEVRILVLGLWVGGVRALARKLCWDEATEAAMLTSL